MRRGLRPILVGGAVVVGTFAFAKAQVFQPSTTTGTAGAGDVARGKAIFAENCSGCHGDGGTGGGVGPMLVGAGLDADTVASAVQQGRGVMPAGIVGGQEQADVVAYVVSISSPSQ